MDFLIPKILLFFILLLRSEISEAFAKNELSKWKLIPTSNTITIEKAMKQYFENRTNLLHVRVQFDGNGIWQNQVIESLAEVLRKSSQMAYVINIQNHIDIVDKLYYNNIWYVDSYRAIRKILPNIRTNQGSYAGRYMILMSLSDHRSVYIKTLKLVFSKLFSLNIIDVNVAVVNEAEQMVLYSYEIFQQKKCRKVQPRISNYFVNGRFVKPKLFPKKLQNFNQCRLHFLSRNVPPFFYHNKDDERNDSIRVHGIEANMIKTIGAQLNFIPSLTIAPEKTWGDVYSNGSITGPFELLENSSVDVLMGYFTYEPKRIMRFGKSISYLMSPMIAITNRRRENSQIRPTWLLDPFGTETWIFTISAFAAAIFLIRFAYSKRLRPLRFIKLQKFPIWLDAVGNALGVSSPIPDAGGSIILRFCIATWSISFLIFNAAYQGQLYVAYNHAVAQPPMKLSDLSRDNYTFFVRYTSELNILLEEAAKVPPQRILRMHTNNNNDIYERVNNFSGKAGTLATKLRILHFMVNRGLYDQLHTLPEELRLQQICAYFRTQSFLIEPFNKIIGAFVSSGLLSKWYKDAELTLQKKLLHLEEQWINSIPVALDFQTFVPVFVVLIVCYIFTFIVCLIELNFKKFPSRPKHQKQKHLK